MVSVAGGVLGKLVLVTTGTAALLVLGFLALRYVQAAASGSAGPIRLARPRPFC